MTHDAFAGGEPFVRPVHQFLQLALGYIIGRVIVSAIFIPAYFRGELVTSYELLQRRFGAPVKTAASGIFLVTRSLADGIRLFATALVIAVVTGVLSISVAHGLSPKALELGRYQIGEAQLPAGVIQETLDTVDDRNGQDKDHDRQGHGRAGHERSQNIASEVSIEIDESQHEKELFPAQ